MNNHRHLSSQEILEQISEGDSVSGVAGCTSCETEAASLSRFWADLRRADEELVATTDWDDLLLRRRIREALAREKPYRRSAFERFVLVRPAFVSALVAILAVAVWVPFSASPDVPAEVAFANPVSERVLPAWDPLPALSDDQGLAVLIEWEPTEDELLIARCRVSCMAGLTSHEEDKLFNTVALNVSPEPIPGASPL